VSTAEFRSAFANFTTTVSIIATDGPAGLAGLTCSAVCAVSDDPPLLLACVHRKSTANAAIKANKVMSISCLSADQSELSQAFAGVGRLTADERFALGDWDVLATGAPCLTTALATFDCEIFDIRDAGTHTVFVAKVIATRTRDLGEPLVYQRRAYATTRKL
jgi:flavin reductase (NADH)/flavin reductase/chlorophenol-4-monooxygenase component 1